VHTREHNNRIKTLFVLTLPGNSDGCYLRPMVFMYGAYFFMYGAYLLE